MPMILDQAAAPSATVVAPSQPREVTGQLMAKPMWLGAPRKEDFEHFYPQEAGRRGFSAIVVLSCKARPTGELVGCEAATEGDYAKDFREAALHLAPLYRMKYPPPGDEPVRFRIRFYIPANRLPMVKVTQPGAREGLVDINCRVGDSGAFDNCFPEDEELHRPDLYDAAYKVAARIAVPHGYLAGARVILPIHVVPPASTSALRP